MSIYGEDVVEQCLPADEILLHFSSLACHMSGELVLRKVSSILSTVTVPVFQTFFMPSL